MKNKRKIIAIVSIIILVLILIGLAIFLTNRDDKQAVTEKSVQNQLATLNKKLKDANVTPQNDQDPEMIDTNQVNILNSVYSPTSIKIKVGDTVTWKNLDNIEHAITKLDANADGPSSSQLKQNESYSYKFEKAGTYKYQPAITGSNEGTVTVTQ